MSEDTAKVKLSRDLLLCDTLTVDLPSITQLPFNSLGNLTGQANFAITLTLKIISWEVVIANSIKAIVNNTVALLIVFECKLLAEFLAVEEIVDVHDNERWKDSGRDLDFLRQRPLLTLLGHFGGELF